MFFAYMPAFGLTLLVGVDVTTEAMPRFPSVLQPDGPGGMIRRIFYPGWASGVLFYTGLGIMNVGLLAFDVARHSAGWGDGVVGAAACALISVVVPVVLQVNRTNRFANWWVVHIGLGVAAILLGIFAGLGSRDFLELGVITPVTGLFASADSYRGGNIILVTTGIGLCWLAAAIVLALREGKIYTGLEAEARRLSEPDPSAP